MVSTSLPLPQTPFPQKAAVTETTGFPVRCRIITTVRQAVINTQRKSRFDNFRFAHVNDGRPDLNAPPARNRCFCGQVGHPFKMPPMYSDRQSG